MLIKGGGSDIDEKQILFEHRNIKLRLDDPRWLNLLCKKIAEHNIKFVVLDTLAKLHHGDENSAQDMGRAMDAIDALRDANKGLSVLYLHHTKKGLCYLDDIDEAIRGSSSLAGFYDAHIALRPPIEDLPIIIMTVRQSSIEQQRFLVKWETDKLFPDDEAMKVFFEMRKLAQTEIPSELSGWFYDKLRSTDEKVWSETKMKEVTKLTLPLILKLKNVLIKENKMVRAKREGSIALPGFGKKENDNE